MDHDFSGYATKANVTCTDGLTIKPEAFKHMNAEVVPLVWEHGSSKVDNVLGKVILQHKDGDGTYCLGFFNGTTHALHAKELVKHGDIDSLSIYANRVKRRGNDVIHGNIKEVSLVLSGANPGAKIDWVSIRHSDGEVEVLDDEMVALVGGKIKVGDEIEHADGKKTYQDVFDSLNDEQRGLVEFMVSEALTMDPATVKQSDEDDDKTTGADKDADTIEHKKGEGTVKRNVFEKNDDTVEHGSAKEGFTLTHAQKTAFFETMKSTGSFKDAVVAHADEYGITNIEVLFPDAKQLDNTPEWITRKNEWVEPFLTSCRKEPFSRIRTRTADLTHAEARAKGYIKGTMKKEQFFSIKGRTTTPTTIYKKQKLDRDDIVDITDFDVVAWLWVEMRFMIREEFARAALIGDGREVDDEDKIDEQKIRPVVHDDEFYTDVVTMPANIDGDGIIEMVLRNRHTYKGTSPNAYMTTEVMMDMLLLKDRMGRRLYDTKAALAAALNVNQIVEVDVMDGVERDGGSVQIILLNPSDYAIGSTKGGELTQFDDFDIDYNQYKYLIEGRACGALTSPKRAQVFVRGAGTKVTPTTPTFNATTGVVTIPNVTGVTYKNEDTNATLTPGAQTALEPGNSMAVRAFANTGYYFDHNIDTTWTYARPVA